MGTTKPQLKVYLKQNTYDEIQDESQRLGINLGDLVTRMWYLFAMQDFNTLADRLERYTASHPFKVGESHPGLIRAGAILYSWVQKK